jgi:hypothetical protein
MCRWSDRDFSRQIAAGSTFSLKTRARAASLLSAANKVKKQQQRKNMALNHDTHSFMHCFLPLQQRHAVELCGDNDRLELGAARVVFAGYFAVEDGAEAGRVQCALHRSDSVL